MKKFLRIIPMFVILSGIFISCGELNRKVDEKVDNVMQKTETIDSLVNKEVDKLLQTDSLIQKGREKTKKIDTIIDKATSKVDSLVKRENKSK